MTLQSEFSGNSWGIRAKPGFSGKIWIGAASGDLGWKEAVAQTAIRVSCVECGKDEGTSDTAVVVYASEASCRVARTHAGETCSRSTSALSPSMPSLGTAYFGSSKVVAAWRGFLLEVTMYSKGRQKTRNYTFCGPK